VVNPPRNAPADRQGAEGVAHDGVRLAMTLDDGSRATAMCGRRAASSVRVAVGRPVPQRVVRHDARAGCHERVDPPGQLARDCRPAVHEVDRRRRLGSPRRPSDGPPRTWISNGCAGVRGACAALPATGAGSVNQTRVAIRPVTAGATRSSARNARCCRSDARRTPGLGRTVVLFSMA
jgi:hypothetical protein